MIGIDMELPKSCNNCIFCVVATTINDLDMLCGVNPDIDTVRGFISSRHPNCKLVDLGKEDMSWDDLKIKCDNLTTDIQFSSDGFDFECKGIWFNRVGTIFSSKLNIEDLKPFEMYQIIKSLVGDER